MLILQTLANAEIKELFLPVSRPEVAKIDKNSKFYFVKCWKTKRTTRKFHVNGHTIGILSVI